MHNCHTSEIPLLLKKFMDLSVWVNIDQAKRLMAEKRRFMKFFNYYQMYKNLGFDMLFSLTY